MPIEAVSGGFRWGQHGRVYPTREGAERQAAAAHAHGYTGDALPAAGVLTRGPSGNVLFVRRGEDGDHAGEWCFPGGGLEHDEGPEAAARREVLEETGHAISGDIRPLARAKDDGVDYTTFAYDVPEYFEPKLNAENTEHVWAPLSAPPQPLHPGVASLIAQLGKIAQQAQDSALRLAMDRDSVRSIDQDGRLRIEVANISKANVCPYRGEEIPDWEELGLDPKREYMLLRDPAELAKAVDSFNSIPLLDMHIPSTAEDHPYGRVVGTTGNDAAFKAPYLTNSLVVWTQDAIDGIDSGEARELSCAYRYRADMTPGTYDGEKYDGVMRDILGNHVALVAAGRAGPDVIVGDSLDSLKETGMTKHKAQSRKAALARGALLAALPALMAADSKKPDLTLALDGVTAKNWLERKPAIAESLKKQGVKFAKDDGGAALAQLLNSLDGAGEADGVGDEEPPAGAAPGAAPGAVPPPPTEGAAPGVDADPVAELIEMLRDKLSPEDHAAVSAKLQAMKPAATDADPGKEPPKPGEMVSKTAMDAALKARDAAADARVREAAQTAERNAIARMNEIDAARDVVFPYAGKLAGAFDSAEGVYRAALDNIGVEHKDIHASALRAVLLAQPKPGDEPRSGKRIAQDGASSKDFATRFPGAAAIRNIG